MSLLPDAAARRRVRQQVLGLLESLRPTDRRVVLEDILDEVYSTESSDEGASELAAPPVRGQPLSRQPPSAPPQDDEEERDARSLAEIVFAWCVKHPTLDGTYLTREAAAAILPGDARGTSKIYTAVIRSSPSSDRRAKNPRFEWLGDGRFELKKS